jgi:uncharacterized oxidoreductase
MRSSAHNVLITGGSRGIGLALAKQFHANGNQVILIGRDSTALAAAIETMPGARSLAIDLAQPRAAAQITESFPDVSVLVNNAGIQINGTFESIPAEDIAREISVNLTAPLTLTHAYLPILRQREEAAIVNVTSILGLVPKESAAVYSATKAALRSFSRALRWQLEDTRVRVFEIVPPVVDTAMTAGRGAAKIPPEAVASAFWKGFIGDEAEILVGKAGMAKVLARLIPSVAEKIIRRA